MRIRPNAAQRMTQRRPTAPGPGFQPLPAPVGPWPYRRVLDHPGPELRFHCVGDTGGWRDPRPQRRVSAAMAAEGADFLYHLGDVVYPHGEPDHYPAQFDAAYADYPAPIFAVPGNHDAENGLLTGELALAPFRAQFCSPTPRGPGAPAPLRPPASQPHLHWTLVHPLIRIVGLWANVPEGGQLASDQLDWLVGELRDCPPATPLILALHQPVYSADVTHGGNLELAELLDACAGRAGRGPDAVLSGHAHLYERFTRVAAGREVPFVVAGAGGYPELHRLAAGVGPLPARFPDVPGVTLDAVVDDAHGFMTLTARPGGAEVSYTAVPAVGEPVIADRFRVSPPSAPGGGTAARRSR